MSRHNTDMPKREDPSFQPQQKSLRLAHKDLEVYIKNLEDGKKVTRIPMTWDDFKAENQPRDFSLEVKRSFTKEIQESIDDLISEIDPGVSLLKFVQRFES